MIMSTFKRMHVVELQSECDARGIDYDGLNKRGLIEALRRFDEEEEEERDGNGMRDGNADNDATIRSASAPDDSGSVGGVTVASDVEGGGLELESVRLMRLKLELTQAE